jgi:hypothetical protein
VPTEQLASLNCAIKGKGSPDGVFYKYFWLYMLLPPIIVLGSGIVWVLIYTCKASRCKLIHRCCNRSLRSKRKSAKEHRVSALKNFKITCILLMFYAYTSIVKSVLAMVSCVEYETPGSNDAYPEGLYFLETDLSIQCWTGTHKFYVSVAALFLVIYALGIPLAAFLLLYKWRDAITYRPIRPCPMHDLKWKGEKCTCGKQAMHKQSEVDMNDLIEDIAKAKAEHERKDADKGTKHTDIVASEKRIKTLESQLAKFMVRDAHGHTRVERDWIAGVAVADKELDKAHSDANTALDESKMNVDDLKKALEEHKGDKNERTREEITAKLILATGKHEAALEKRADAAKVDEAKAHLARLLGFPAGAVTEQPAAVRKAYLAAVAEAETAAEGSTWHPGAGNLGRLVRAWRHVDEHRETAVQVKRFHDHIFATANYGFLFTGYKQEGIAPYWEVTVVILRKLLLLSVVIGLRNQRLEIQSVVALFILFIATILHTWYEPYDARIHDTIELYSLVVGEITLFLGLFFQFDHGVINNPNLKIALTGFIVLLNGGFFFGFLCVFLRTLVRMAPVGMQKFFARHFFFYYPSCCYARSRIRDAVRLSLETATDMEGVEGYTTEEITHHILNDAQTMAAKAGVDIVPHGIHKLALDIVKMEHVPAQERRISCEERGGTWRGEVSHQGGVRAEDVRPSQDVFLETLRGGGETKGAEKFNDQPDESLVAEIMLMGVSEATARAAVMGTNEASQGGEEASTRAAKEAGPTAALHLLTHFVTSAAEEEGGGRGKKVKPLTRENDGILTRFLGARKDQTRAAATNSAVDPVAAAGLRVRTLDRQTAECSQRMAKNLGRETAAGRTVAALENAVKHEVFRLQALGEVEETGQRTGVWRVSSHSSSKKIREARIGHKNCRRASCCHYRPQQKFDLELEKQLDDMFNAANVMAQHAKELTAYHGHVLAQGHIDTPKNQPSLRDHVQSKINRLRALKIVAAMAGNHTLVRGSSGGGRQRVSGVWQEEEIKGGAVDNGKGVGDETTNTIEGNDGNEDNEGNDSTQGKDWVRNPAVMNALLDVLGAPQAKSSPGIDETTESNEIKEALPSVSDAASIVEQGAKDAARLEETLAAQRATQHVRLEERRAAAREKGAVVKAIWQKDEGVGGGDPKSRADEIQRRREAFHWDEEDAAARKREQPGKVGQEEETML